VSLFIDSAETCALQYHLGLDSEHTVYEAEIVGLTLAFHLLSSLTFSPRSLIIVGSDSQATLRALLNQRSHPAQYLLNHVHDAAENLHAKHYKLRNPGTSLPMRRIRRTHTRNILNLQLHWTPGHVDFLPNE